MVVYTEDIELDQIQPAPLPQRIEDEGSDMSEGQVCISDLLPLTQKVLFNKYTYTGLYTVINLTLVSCIVYYQSITSSIEKRFKMNTKSIGLIKAVNDVVQILFCFILAYGASKSHRPRWMAMGLLGVALYCILNVLPEVVYGPGSNAYRLVEQARNSKLQRTAGAQDRASICSGDSKMICEEEQENFGVAVFLTLAHIMLGLGCSIIFTAGASYLDDNIKKRTSPFFYSFTNVGQSLGTLMGNMVASVALSHFVIPQYTSIVDHNDPQYLGAWWIGWVLFGVFLIFLSLMICCFPRSLVESDQDYDEKYDVSFKDLKKTFFRLLKNRTHMSNHLSAVFYNFGYIGLWTYMPKYVEIMFSTSAANSNSVVGIVNFAFFTIGLLLSCIAVWYKVHARKLTVICLFLGALTVMGTFTHAFQECSISEKPLDTLSDGILTTNCNATCNCDYAIYFPVCAYGQSFISPCHAGCSRSEIYPNGTKIFSECECVRQFDTYGKKVPQIAKPGECPNSCRSVFYSLVVLLALQKLFEGISRLPKFLICVRCVDERDKSVAIAFGVILLSMCAFVPAPIVYGSLLDYVCIFWGKTCRSKGNCWLYNKDNMKFYLNALAACSMFVGVIFEFIVWYFVKDLELYDNKKKNEHKNVNKEEDEPHEPLEQQELQ